MQITKYQMKKKHTKQYQNFIATNFITLATIIFEIEMIKFRMTLWTVTYETY